MGVIIANTGGRLNLEPAADGFCLAFTRQIFRFDVRCKIDHRCRTAGGPAKSFKDLSCHSRLATFDITNDQRKPVKIFVSVQTPNPPNPDKPELKIED